MGRCPLVHSRLLGYSRCSLFHFMKPAIMRFPLGVSVWFALQVLFALISCCYAAQQQGIVSFAATDGTEFTFGPVELAFEDTNNYSVKFTLRGVVEHLWKAKSPIVHHTYQKIGMFDGSDVEQLIGRLESETNFKSYRVGVRGGEGYEEVNDGAVQPSYLKEVLFARNTRAEAIHPLLFCFEATQRLVLPEGLLGTVVDQIQNRVPHTYVSSTNDNVPTRVYGLNVANDRAERYSSDQIKHTEWQHTANINTETSYMHLKHTHTPVKTVVSRVVVVGKQIGAKYPGEAKDEVASISFYATTPEFSPRPGEDKMDRAALIVQWTALK
eukprot:GDKI01048086.1.p1 GENE.GDKI01048086.1~~GDKI01048086.1.p1  ORF type:complete len:326 (-),score=67.06 GDKI01048086.1:187-1164(-)